MRRGAASLEARKVALTSASSVELMTVFIIFARAYTTPFGVGFFVGATQGLSGLLLRKKMARARLWAFDSDRYDVSLAVHRIISERV